MPIVFDEVVGSVEPERSSSSDEQSREQQTPPSVDLGVLRGQIQRVEQRAERLKAD